MKCQECKKKMSVIETITTERVVYRKRMCPVCGKTIYTAESVDETKKFIKAYRLQDNERRQRLKEKK